MLKYEVCTFKYENIFRISLSKHILDVSFQKSILCHGLPNPVYVAEYLFWNIYYADNRAHPAELYILF